ncbi:MAG: hypothetical protein ACJ72N_05955 [Labedaea sp.]
MALFRDKLMALFATRGGELMYITEEQVLRRFPELRELVALRRAGWTFRLIGDRDNGIEGVIASYSQRQYTDALWIYDQGTIIGVRVLDEAYGGGTVWSKQDGTLPEVVAELLGLPDPDDRLAPRLVKGTNVLWLPHGRCG